MSIQTQSSWFYLNSISLNMKRASGERSTKILWYLLSLKFPPLTLPWRWKCCFGQDSALLGATVTVPAYWCASQSSTGCKHEWPALKRRSRHRELGGCVLRAKDLRCLPRRRHKPNVDSPHSNKSIRAHGCTANGNRHLGELFGKVATTQGQHVEA